MRTTINVNDFLVREKTKNLLIKNDIFDIETLLSKSEEDLKKLGGFGPTAISDIKTYLVTLKLKLKPKPPKAKDADFQLKQAMVDKFLKDEKKINEFGNNMRVAANLLKKYPDRDFWSRFTIPFKLNTLLFFYGEQGKEMIGKAYYSRKDESIKIERVELSTEKVGMDIVSKPKSIRDFLND